MGEPLEEVALDRLFRQARTFNGYLDRPVASAQLHAIWDLMKMGPTSANCLPARLVWCVSQDARERLAACMKPANAVKVRSAPVSVVIGMDLAFHEALPDLFPHVDARSWFANDESLARATAFRNSSLQGGYLIVAARALGLDVGPMSGFDATAVNRAFFAGSVEVNFVATLGYGDPATLFERSPRPDFARFNRVA